MWARTWNEVSTKRNWDVEKDLERDPKRRRVVRGPGRRGGEPSSENLSPSSPFFPWLWRHASNPNSYSSPSLPARLWLSRSSSTRPWRCRFCCRLCTAPWNPKRRSSHVALRQSRTSRHQGHILPACAQHYFPYVSGSLLLLLAIMHVFHCCFVSGVCWLAGVCVAWCPILDKFVEVDYLEVTLCRRLGNVVSGVGVVGFHVGTTQGSSWCCLDWW